MIIENNPEKACQYEQAGVDRIFIDLEILGKVERQGHLDTVISDHSLSDVALVKQSLTKAELLVRINPVHRGSEKEINEVIEAGADVVMLPMFTSPEEVEFFIRIVGGRAKVCLLLETPQALIRVNDILMVKGIDEVHIGLNDLHLGMGLDFMFELVSSGIMNWLAQKIISSGAILGFGGVASLSGGLVSGEKVIRQHAIYGSQLVILSRGFKDECSSLLEFSEQVKKLKKVYCETLECDLTEMENYKKEFNLSVQQVVSLKRTQNNKFFGIDASPC